MSCLLHGTQPTRHCNSQGSCHSWTMYLLRRSIVAALWFVATDLPGCVCALWLLRLRLQVQGLRLLRHVQRPVAGAGLHEYAIQTVFTISCGPRLINEAAELLRILFNGCLKRARRKHTRVQSNRIGKPKAKGMLRWCKSP